MTPNSEIIMVYDAIVKLRPHLTTKRDEKRFKNPNDPLHPVIVRDV